MDDKAVEEGHADGAEEEAGKYILDHDASRQRARSPS
jgi:hypothetical protein